MGWLWHAPGLRLAGEEQGGRSRAARGAMPSIGDHRDRQEGEGVGAGGRGGRSLAQKKPLARREGGIEEPSLKWQEPEGGAEGGPEGNRSGSRGGQSHLSRKAGWQ